MPKPVLGPRHRTNPLIWCAAIICTILTVAVIIAGIIVFVGYLTIKPRVPQVSITRAQLDTIYFDQAGLLTVQVTIGVNAENDNVKASATFYNITFGLIFHGQTIANLVADPFSIPANKTVELNYVAQSSPIPLNPEEAEAAASELRQGVMIFELRGTARTRWRVGLIGSFKFWLHLDCELRLPLGGASVDPRCSSRSR